MTQKYYKHIIEFYMFYHTDYVEVQILVNDKFKGLEEKIEFTINGSNIRVAFYQLVGTL